MSEYALCDFTESLDQVDLNGAKPVRVIKAWGYSPEGYGSWEGGFVLKLDDGRFAYLSGWCDTTGWGCQDGVDIRFARSVRGLALPEEHKSWDPYPADLNRWIDSGMKDPYSV